MAEKMRPGAGNRLGWVAVVLALMLAALPAAAQSLGGSARVDAEASRITSDRQMITVDLALSQPVPYRIRHLPSPPRLVLDLNTVDWGALQAAPGPGIRDLRLGVAANGWARMVIDLTGPYRLREAGFSGTDPGSATAPRLSLRLERDTLEGFTAIAQDEDRFIARYGDALLHPGAPALPRSAQPLVVVLDPGHGGADPGAERDGLRESDLMLAFARELRDALRRAGGFEVALTRDADVFMTLDARIRAARAAGADVFLSLHADALPDGIASGSTLYSLSEEASDQSAAILAERHDRADLLAGVDLTRAEDAIADVLMSIAQVENRPRTDLLAESLISSIDDHGLRLHSRPHQSGGFSVLRAPDIPSLLIELGFMSNPRDLANLQDPDWRARMQAALVRGLQDWAEADAALAPLRRR